ncbi:MAG TPA: hypothetical protein V6C57_25920 [Coleofasciculaceae cyanobacterium]
MPTFNLKNMTVQCIQASADVGAAAGDDLYLTVNGSRRGIINNSAFPQGRADTKAAFFTGQFGTALPNNGFRFNDVATISLFDRDDTTVDGITGLFEGGDDFIGSAQVSPPSDGTLFHYSFDLVGGGSSYRVGFDVALSSSSPIRVSLVAPVLGGVINGNNKNGKLTGRQGKDILNAKGGNDLLLGNGNSDILNGGTGDDVLVGGQGNDKLIGGSGSDTLIVARNQGLDTIQDFRSSDRIGLGSGLRFEDLSFVQGAGGTFIKSGDAQLAFLKGVKSNQLLEANFTQVKLTDFSGQFTERITV